MVEVLEEKPNKLSKKDRIKKRLWGPSLVVASFLAALAGKGDTGGRYNPDSTTPSAATSTIEIENTTPDYEVTPTVEVESRPVPFENVFQGTKSLYTNTQPEIIVITNREDFEANWKMFSDGRPIQEVDFDNWTVLVVAQGKSEGGRSMVEFKKITSKVVDGKNTLDAEVESTFPDASCPLLPQKESTFQVISIPKVTGQEINLKIKENPGCYNIGYATSSRFSGGVATYSPPTVTKEPFNPVN